MRFFLFFFCALLQLFLLVLSRDSFVETYTGTQTHTQEQTSYRLTHESPPKKPQNPKSQTQTLIQILADPSHEPAPSSGCVRLGLLCGLGNRTKDTLAGV